MDDDHRTLSLSFTPPTAGNYLVRILNDGMRWILPDPIKFTATGTSQAQGIEMASAALSTSASPSGEVGLEAITTGAVTATASPSLVTRKSSLAIQYDVATLSAATSNVAAHSRTILQAAPAASSTNRGFLKPPVGLAFRLRQRAAQARDTSTTTAQSVRHW